MPIPKRRQLLANALCAAALSATSITACSATPAAEPLIEPVASIPALNARARKRGMFYGSAVNHDTLTKDAAAMSHVDAECGMVVGESSFKWEAVHPAADRYDFTESDALLNWATKHDIRTRGHTLVWHEANPAWLKSTINPGNAEKLLTDHIKTVVGRYAKRLVHWDVVNEVVEPNDKKELGLRDTIWLRALGPAYLDIAFHATAAADPQALRVINDYGIDYAIPWQDRKRAALLELLSTLLHRGVPIQAVGLQAHLDAGEINLDQKILSRFVADIASMGLKVIVTELDVRDDRLPADIPSRDTAVADHAKAWLDAVVPNPAVLGVLTWGLSDRRSWLNTLFPRPDGLPQRPLPLDPELNRTKLWAAMAASLDVAPTRTVATRT